MITVLVMSWAAVAALFAANRGELSRAWRDGAFALTVGGVVASAVLTRSTAVAVGAALALAGLMAPARRLVGDRLPMFHPESPVHAVGLALFCLAMGLSLQAHLGPPATTTGDLTAINLTVALAAATGFAGVLTGVGFGVRRDLGTALRRLGVWRPAPRELMIASATGLLAALAVVAANAAISIRLGHTSPSPTSLDVPTTLRSYAAAATPLLLLAAVIEEVIIRGALRPRAGNLWSSLLFAAIHGLGAGIGTLEMFALSVLLGRVWQRGGLAGSTAGRLIYIGTVTLATTVVR